MFEKIRKNLVISIAAGALVFLLLSVYADFNNVYKSLLNFNWYYIPFLFLFSFSNYFFRFLKWHYYLNLLKIKISLRESFYVFMAGLMMSLTPGKLGEVLKCYLIKERTGNPVSRTAPIILAERITDFLSLVIISIIGAYIYGYGKEFIIIIGIIFIELAVILGNRNLLLPLVKSVSKIKIFAKYMSKLLQAYESTNNLLTFKPLLKMTLLSLPAWLFECYAMYLILNFYGENISVMLASFIYSFSTIAGSVTMLPAGLGVTEGSLTFLLVLFGVNKGIAVGTTFIIRIVTLWFAIFTGIIFAFLYQKEFGKIKFDEIKKEK